MERVLKYFKEICSIPHGSYNIKAISDYLVDFAKKRNLEVRQDEVGNVVIKKPASKGYENEAGIIIQGHMDMVAVKKEGCTLNMEKEGLILEEKDGYLYAKDTSLGGDDGIAVAMALAILEEDIPHPSLECVFTVNEEVGMDGAIALDMSDIKGKFLLNIDSEEEGVITTSCAGGVRLASLLKTERNIDIKENLFSIAIRGLKGGHSGTSIHEGRCNGNILAGRLLKAIREKGSVIISDIKGGEKDNAIPNFADILISTDLDEDALKEVIVEFDYAITKEYSGIEDNIGFTVTPLIYSEKECVKGIDKTDIIIDILNEVPDGVISMCDGIDMVKTSLNLGIMTLDEEGFKLDFCIRSSSAKEKEELKERVGKILALKGCELATSGDYPGWEFNKDSLLTKRAVSAYEEVYKSTPIVTGVHAGLECGILIEKKKDLDAISIGPNILNIHTVNEKLDLKSTERTWEFVKKILEIKG